MLLTGGRISRLQPAGHCTTKRKSSLIFLRIADELLDVLPHRDFRDVKCLPTLKIVVFPFSHGFSASGHSPCSLKRRGNDGKPGRAWAPNSESRGWVVGRA